MLAGFVLSAIVVALMLGVGGVVTVSNLGYFSRAIALIAFPAIAYLCWTVLRRTPTLAAG